MTAECTGTGTLWLDTFRKLLGRRTSALQQEWCPEPIWQSPAIFLQQSISACVIAGLGRHARTGIAVHNVTKLNRNMERPFAMAKCYILT
jgi:hypothetical protein